MQVLTLTPSVDFGVYPICDVLTVVPVQVIFADRSIRINNRSLYITVLNYGLM